MRSEDKQITVAYYPLALNLKGRLAVVIGGGFVAQRKVKALLGAKARLKIVSPTLTAGLKRLALQGKAVWIPRPVRRSDVKGAHIVVAATSDNRVNRDVSRWAHREGVWVNVVDNSGLSDFISPAVLKKQTAIIAVYTDGKDPVLSRDLKNFLKEHWDVFLSYRHRL